MRPVLIADELVAGRCRLRCVGTSESGLGLGGKGERSACRGDGGGLGRRGFQWWICGWMCSSMACG
jgi:hypothetical protein